MVSFTYPREQKSSSFSLKKKIPQAKKCSDLAKAKHEKKCFLKNGLTLVGLSILKVPRKAVQRRSKKRFQDSRIPSFLRKQ